MKVILTLIISLILLLGLVAGMFVYYATSSPGYEKNNITNPFFAVSSNNSDVIINQEMIISEEHISYLLNDMGAYNLKSYLGENPRIETEVDKEKFNSEVEEGKITTKRGETEDEDISIITSKEEVIKIATASDARAYIQESVSSGKTSIKLKAGYSKLFAKGYLNLYTEITGKTLTGSVIKIFSS